MRRPIPDPMPIQEILRERGCGVVRCAAVRVGGPELAPILRRMGLSAEEAELLPMKRGEAVETLVALLWKDLAYDLEIMPRERARALAEAFVATYAGTKARFYSNAQWSRYRGNGGGGVFSYASLTDATFDGGLLIVNPDSAACVWVEDED